MQKYNYVETTECLTDVAAIREFASNILYKL